MSGMSVVHDMVDVTLHDNLKLCLSESVCVRSFIVSYTSHCACCIIQSTVRCSSGQVELPLGATEDRICGTIDIEKALSEGVKAYEPGLLVRRLEI